MSKGQGNVKEQRKRRKRMKKAVARSPDEFLLIDGNWSHYPYAYCKRKDGYLTLGLVQLHHCDTRQCEQYERVIL